MPERLPGAVPRSHGLRLACWLLLAVMLPARADIEVSIAAGPDRDAWFLVQTRSNHARLHGSHTHPIDARLMRPGETARIPLLVLNPLTFSYLYASSYHPAYRYQTRRAGEMPSLIRTVRLPAFEPASWQDFIDAGEPVHHAGHGVHLGNVVDHFRLFIDPYLPAMDAAGKGAALPAVVPLFEALIAHTRATLPQTGYGMPSVDARRRDDAAYAQRLAAHEQGQLSELDALLGEIRALLAAGPDERLRLRALQARAVNAGTVYHELMSEHDRQTIETFLEFQYRNSRSQPRPARTLQWLDSAAGIRYTIRLGPRYSLRGGDGRRDYEDCYRTGLEVDLYGGRETALKDTRRALQANFCRAGEVDWLIQLPGGG